MPHDLTNLPSRAKESWRGAPLEARLQWLLTSTFVMHPDLVRLLNAVTRLYKRAQRRHKGATLLAVIASGGGKSHLVRLLKHALPDETSSTGTIKRVVAVSVPSFPSPTSMSKALLKALGDPDWNGKHEDGPLNRATHLIARLGTLVVCIDNAQDIPGKRGAKGVELVGNWIRDLWDQSACLILLLGTPVATAIIRSNEQLRRRSPARIDVPYFDCTDSAGLARLKRFLQLVDEALPIAESSDLHRHAKEIYWATFGIPDFIFELLGQAIEVAVDDGRESIQVEDLRQAFDLVMLDAGRGLNPFMEDGPQRPLDRENEPFFNWSRVPRGEQQAPRHAGRASAAKPPASAAT